MSGHGARRMLSVVAVLLGASLLPSAAWATNVSGSISANTTWGVLGSPYVMTGDVTVDPGVTLAIDPGVLVQAANSTVRMQVNGSLQAVGSLALGVVFTSLADSAPGQWRGLSFGGTGTSLLKFAQVRYGGSGTSEPMIAIANSGPTVTIEDSFVERAMNEGISAGGTLTVRRTQVLRNGVTSTSPDAGTHDGIWVNSAKITVVDSALWLNGDAGIEFNEPAGSPGPSTVMASSIWGNGGVGVKMTVAVPTALLPKGNGNSIYGNGADPGGRPPVQIASFDAQPTSDWSNNYWGVTQDHDCSLGTANGHIDWAWRVPDSNDYLFTPPIFDGPAQNRREVLFVGPGPFPDCANDYVYTRPALFYPPAIQFPPPGATYSGIPLAQTFGCKPTCQANDQLLAPALRQVQPSLAARPLSPFALVGFEVNAATGTLSESYVDAAVRGPGVGFHWSRSYNSRDLETGLFGVGWATTFEARVTVESGTGDLLYRSGTGQQTRFKRVTDASTGNPYFLSRGFDGTLVRQGDGSYVMTMRDRRSFAFNPGGQLTSIAPRFGPATTLAYVAGKLSSITDGAGRVVTVGYDVTFPSLVGRVTLSDGRFVQYGYTAGRLATVQDLRGDVSTLTYNAAGLLTSVKDALNHFSLQNVLYDGQGRVTSEQNGTGDSVSYAYSQASPYDVTSVTKSGRGTWTYRFDKNVLLSATDPVGRTETYEYDINFHLASIVDGRGNRRSFSYDAIGNITKETPPAPNTWTISRTYNGTNDLLTETDGRGNTTTNTYATSSDPVADYQLGQLKQITDRKLGTSVFTYYTSSSVPTPPAAVIGQVKTITNARGFTTTFAWDGQGNQVTRTSALGRVQSYCYDAVGRVIRATDPRGLAADRVCSATTPQFTKRFAYNANDDLSSVIDALGHTTSFGYDIADRRTSMTTPDGVTVFGFDNADRPTTVQSPRGGIATTVYDPAGAVSSETAPNGQMTTYIYDAAGQLLTMRDPLGNVAGASAQTQLDNTSTYGYDGAGNRTSVAHPDGGTQSWTYDELDRVAMMLDANAHATSYTYDANDNLKTVIDAASKQTQYGYDELDRRISVTNARSNSRTTTYFSTGELASQTSQLGNKTTFELDGDGRVSGMVEPRGNVSGGTPSLFRWSYGYDLAGNRTSTSDPLGDSWVDSFDAENNRVTAKDARTNQTAYGYDAMNRVVTVTPPAAGGTGTLATTYTYDTDGNLKTRTDPNAHLTTWTYDASERLTQMQNPIGTWKYTLDANDRLTRIETALGTATVTPTTDGLINYAYDRIGRRTGIDYSDTTPDVTIAYDAAGRRTSMADGLGSETYGYFANDWLNTVTRAGADAGLNGTLTYGYDNAGNINARTYPDGTVTSAVFDNDERLASVTQATDTVTLAYDAAANLQTSTLPSANGYVATSTYDNAGRLVSTEHKKGTSTLSKFTRVFDADANPVTLTTLRGTTTVFDRFGYDTRSRLTGACYSVATATTACASTSTNRVFSTYDKTNNTLTRVAAGAVPNPGTTTNTYNAKDQLSQSVAGTTTTFTYDANGNQTGEGTRTRAYDLANRLTSTTLAAVTSTYAYDGDGKRLKSTTTSGADLRYSWDPQADSGLAELVHERTPAGVLVRRYLNGPQGALRYQVPGTGTPAQYLHRDLLGSITDTTNPAGTPQWRYTYDPYGRARSTINVSGSAPENRLAYTGQYLDTETGDYHLRARQYSPITGNFRSTDPIDNRLLDPISAPYAYATGNPGRFTDPTGLSAWEDVAGTIGSAGGYINDDVISPTGQALSDPIGTLSATATQLGRDAWACRFNTQCLAMTEVVEPIARDLDHAIGLARCGDYQAATGRLFATVGELAPFARIGKLARLARTTKVGTGGADAVRVGQAGEAAVRDAFEIGPKATRVINGRTRFFDGLTDDAVSEVKNVKSLSYTRQLRDYADYASANGLRLDVYVRVGTRVSGPLARADLDPASPINIIRHLP